MQKFMPDKMSTMNLPGRIRDSAVLGADYGVACDGAGASAAETEVYAAAGLAGFLIADCALGGFCISLQADCTTGNGGACGFRLDLFEDGTEQMKLAAGDETLERLQALAFFPGRPGRETGGAKRELVRGEGTLVCLVFISG